MNKVLHNGRIMTQKDGYSVITPAQYEEKTLFCPVCRFPLENSDDVMSYKQYQACNPCSLKWAEANREKWKEGWRPERAIINEEIEFRNASKKARIELGLKNVINIR